MTYTLHPVESARSPAFDEAYTALFEEFGPRGELERRDVLRRWLEEGARVRAGCHQSYHLFIVRDESGKLAAVRDFHVSTDAEAGVTVVYLAHALVLPPYRRSGAGQLLRRHPAEFAEALLRGRTSDRGELLLAAEMEPADPEDEASQVRLVAYGREGFRALDPGSFPYFQPDFRDLDASAGPPQPLALLAVVRWVGHEAESVLPKRLAGAFLSHLYAVFGSHVARAHLGALSELTSRRLHSSASEGVPLLALPESIADRERLTPLFRDRVLSQFPRDPRCTT